MEQRAGFASFLVTGKRAEETFLSETGGHRWQRIPPNEKRGRVHTSTVTVAVMPEPTLQELVIPERDLEWSTCRGSGAGGQHRNKTESAVQLRHVPSGLTVRCEAERSQHSNKLAALAVLRTRIRTSKENQAHASRAADRRSQIGSGMRGDKRRTIRADGVVDHVTGRTWTFRDYVRGFWD